MRSLITDLEARGFRPRIDQSWRSAADHAAQVAQGTSQSSWSFHMATAPDGTPEALAVDLLDDEYPVPVAHQSEWPVRYRHYLLTLASLAAGYDLHTGIEWGLSGAVRQGLHQALITDPINYVGPLGWDPSHVEPRSLSLMEAKIGERPDW